MFVFERIPAGGVDLVACPFLFLRYMYTCCIYVCSIRNAESETKAVCLPLVFGVRTRTLLCTRTHSAGRASSSKQPPTACPSTYHLVGSSYEVSRLIHSSKKRQSCVAWVIDSPCFLSHDFEATSHRWRELPELGRTLTRTLSTACWTTARRR